MTTTKTNRISLARQIAAAWVEDGTRPEDTGFRGTLDPVHLTNELIETADGSGEGDDFRKVHKIAAGRFQGWVDVLANEAEHAIGNGLEYFLVRPCFDQVVGDEPRYHFDALTQVMLLVRSAIEGAARRRPAESLAVAERAAELARLYDDADRYHGWGEWGDLMMSRGPDLLRLATLAQVNALRVAGDFAAAAVKLDSVGATNNQLLNAEIGSISASLFNAHRLPDEAEKALGVALKALDVWHHQCYATWDAMRKVAKDEGKPAPAEDPNLDEFRHHYDLHKRWSYDLERRLLLQLGDLLDRQGRHLEAVDVLFRAVSLEVTPVRQVRDCDIELSIFAVGALVEALLNAGDVASAQVWRPLLGKLHLLAPSDLAAARIMRLDALLLIGSGHVETGVEQLRNAVTAFDLAARPFDMAHCALDLAEALAGAGDERGAVETAELAVRGLLEDVPGLHPQAVAELESTLDEVGVGPEADETVSWQAMQKALPVFVQVVMWAAAFRARQE